jgi:uncharacterized protein
VVAQARAARHDAEEAHQTTIARWCAAAARRLASLDLEGRQRLLRTLVDEIVVRGSMLEIHGVLAPQAALEESTTMLDLPDPRRYTGPVYVKNSLVTTTYAVLGESAGDRAKDAAAMIIRVSELEEQGLRIDDVEALAGAFSDPEWRLESVALEVEADGTDVFVRGRLAATMPQACSRCLETFPARVEVPVDVRLVPRPAAADSVELGADDLDVDFYAADELDLGRLVETETTLALPMKPLCRPDCRGLCAVCGANRNLAPCTCASRPPDPPLAALRDLAARQAH